MFSNMIVAINSFVVNYVATMLGIPCGYRVKTGKETWRLLGIVLLTICLYDHMETACAEHLTTQDSFAFDADPSIDAEELMRQAKSCAEIHSSFMRNKSELYCDAIYDQFLCWGYAKAGTRVTQNCPSGMPFIDPRSYQSLLVEYYGEHAGLAEEAIRYCGLDGNWLDRENKSSTIGWTDFIKCFPSHIQDLLENVAKTSEGFWYIMEIAFGIRILECTAFFSSITCLITAITIFTVYPRLLNYRTKIHRQFFCILLLQGVTSLSIYIDQATTEALKNHNIICISVYAFYEVLCSISFAFMFVEGFLLYTTVHSNVLRPKFRFRMLLMCTFLFSIAISFIWFAVAYSKYGSGETNRCWFGYNLDQIYWILQGPRLCVLIVNFSFLLTVIKTLFQTLAKKDTTEYQRIRKVVRAVTLLMPLLGLSNYMSLTNPPLTNDSTVGFAIWAFSAQILKALQGTFVSFIYCFTNAEVREEVWGRGRREVEGNTRAIQLRELEQVDPDVRVTRQDLNLSLELEEVVSEKCIPTPDLDLSSDFDQTYSENSGSYQDLVISTDVVQIHSERCVTDQDSDLSPELDQVELKECVSTPDLHLLSDFDQTYSENSGSYQDLVISTELDPIVSEKSVTALDLSTESEEVDSEKCVTAQDFDLSKELEYADSEK